jgi:cytochrome P450
MRVNARKAKLEVPVTELSTAAIRPRSRRAPGLGAAASLSTLSGLRADPLRFLTELRERFGDVARFQIGPMKSYLLSHPDAIRHVLVDRSQNYTKHTRDYDKLRISLGDGLVTSEGEFWRRQRRIAQPAFHREQIARFGETMVARTEAMLARWRDRTEPFDVAREMTRLTLEIVSATLFSVDLGAQLDEIEGAVSIANRQTYERIISIIDLPLWVPTPRNLEMKRSLRTFDEIIFERLRARRAAGGGDDLLGMLLAARDPETGEGMSDAQLRDEIVTMFVAGHETTANGLAWCLWLLATHPEVEARARAQAAALGRRATLADLPALGYLRQVFQEALRLYPPVWGIGRGAVEADEIGGYAIDAGADVTICQWVTHRHPALWRDPERFDPDRFADGEISRYAYFPFSTGARQCIGNNFALMEGQLILATLLQHERLELVSETVVPEPLVTLRPRGGLLMRRA